MSKHPKLSSTPQHQRHNGLVGVFWLFMDTKSRIGRPGYFKVIRLELRAWRRIGAYLR